MNSKKRWLRAEALAVAEKLKEELAPICDRIEIAGSLRRGKSKVGDIELLYVSKTEFQNDPRDMFSKRLVALADERLEKWLCAGIIIKRPSIVGVTTWGFENKFAVHADTGIPVDFFRTDESRWWVALVIRTGSKETNLKLATEAKRRGRRLIAYGQGVEVSGLVHRCISERDVFELCGVPYLEPQDR